MAKIRFQEHPLVDNQSLKKKDNRIFFFIRYFKIDENDLQIILKIRQQNIGKSKPSILQCNRMVC